MEKLTLKKVLSLFETYVDSRYEYPLATISCLMLATKEHCATNTYLKHGEQTKEEFMQFFSDWYKTEKRKMTHLPDSIYRDYCIQLLMAYRIILKLFQNK